MIDYEKEIQACEQFIEEAHSYFNEKEKEVKELPQVTDEAGHWALQVAEFQLERAREAFADACYVQYLLIREFKLRNNS